MTPYDVRHSQSIEPGERAQYGVSTQRVHFFFGGYYYPVTLRPPCAARDRR